MKTNSYFTKLFIILFITIMLFPFKGFTQRTNTSDKNTSEFVPGTIVIKVKEGIGPYEKQEAGIHFGIPSLDKTAVKYKVTKLEKRFKHKPIAKNSGLPDLSRIYRIEFPESQNVHQVAKVFAADPNIEYAEPMPVGKFTETPDDPSYGIQQHLPQIMAPEAWDVHKGEDGEEVVVAIIDTGADWLHPDLTENCWQNLGEDADGDGVTLEFNDGVWERDPDDLNGIDDDNNGYIDDVIGWDFHEQISIGDGSNPDPLWNQGPFEHGTHCAGIAAGRTNNGIGISSVSWNIKYMPVQTDDGNNTVLYGIDGVIYAAENGADIISNSWYHGYTYSQSDNDAMQYAIGLGSIVCFAAANDNSSNVALPAGYPGVISVAAVNPNDTRASFSNYGIAVDVAAPGVSILSTITNNSYASWGGTSMATPMVAGMFGLLKSYQPDWSNDELIEQVIGSTDNIDDLNPGYENALGSGRINAYEALVGESIEIPQELRIEFLDYTMADEDGDGALEAGETVTVSFTMRNYAHLVSDSGASMTLSSIDPDIHITSDIVNAIIPEDAVIEVTNAFEFTIDENTSPHIADFIIEIESDYPVLYDHEIEIIAIIGPSGFFVWEGESNTPDYSGLFIKDYLESRGLNVVYSDEFPRSFTGFDAVFLSFGNAGQNANQGTLLDYPHTVTIQDYLENGNSLYSEGSPFMIVPFFAGFPNADEFLGLYGVDGVTTSFDAPNPISNLSGVSGSIVEGMNFYSSTQQLNWYIDQITGNQNSMIPFNEDNYGNVSIYNEGEYGQKTFHLGYSLADLVDEDVHSNRYNLLKKIMDFFGYTEEDGFIITNFSANQTEGEPELEVQFTNWTFTDDNTEITGWAWDFDEDGIYDSYEQDPVWTYTKGGVYDVQLVAFSDDNTDTLVKKEFITVRSGILVYEGLENENGYSGAFIKTYLENHAYDEIGYTTTFPTSLSGYTAIFLSFGNTGMRSTEITSSMANTLNVYILNGGKVYIEGGDALVTLENLWEMFGLSDVEDGEKNTIDDLSGQDDAITKDIQFGSTNQLSYRSIDRYTIFDEIPAIQVAFQESEYGNVAVEFNGQEMFGQKTFCMSYALADLEDGEGLNTRDELLLRILNFFDIISDVEEPSAISPIHLKVYPNPVSDHITLDIDLENGGQIEVVMYDPAGRKIFVQNLTYSKGVHRLDYNTQNLPGGIYYFNIRTEGHSESIKWVKVD